MVSEFVFLAHMKLTPDLSSRNKAPREHSGGAGGAVSCRDDWSEQTDFPKENPERAFEALKVFQPDGSVYRVPVEDWAAARGRVADDPDWAAWLSEQKADVDAWMGRHRDRVEWQSGWFHDFVSPADASFLVWTEDIPGEQIDCLFDAAGRRVELTPTLFDAWVRHFREQHLVQTVTAARLSRLLGESRYAKWAADQLDFYAANLGRWPVTNAKGNDARLGCQSLDDATFLNKLVEAARLLKEWAGPFRFREWFDRLLKPEAELLNRSFQVIHNIAVWQRSVQAQVALLGGDEAMWARVIDGEYGLREQLRRGVTADWFWAEQSLWYNEYIVEATSQLFVMAGLLGRSDRLRAEAAIVQNLLLAPMAIRFPNNALPNPADINRTMVVPSPQVEKSYRTLPTALGLAAAAASRNWDTLLDPPPPPMPPEMPPVKSCHLASTRFALLKEGPWQVFLHYGQVKRSHSQAEALNWSASFDGIDFTHDPGTPGYGSPLTDAYFRRGLCHNVPLVDGEGQLPWRPGEMSLFDVERCVMTGVQPDYRPGVSAARTLRIAGERLMDEVTLSSAESAARMGLALHLQAEPRLCDAFRPADDFAADRPEPFQYWQDVVSAVFTDQASVDVVLSDGRVLRVTFSAPGRFVLYIGSAPDFPPARRAGFYLECLEERTDVLFTTEFTEEKETP